MGDEALFLARVQFAFTVSFHFIFPAFSIGLASFLMVLEGAWLRTGRGVYANLYRYWLKIFAVAFGMGVVSGIVMSYQFGTNWSVFSDKAGPVVGPLMAYEVLTAFFLEAGFLGVMLFGINKVGPKLHFFATCMVALGTFISATWIISTNSWMHTPQGFAMNAQGQFVPAGSWLPRCASLPAHQRTAARGTRHLRAAHKLPDSTGRAGAVADHPYPVPRRGACETARPGACEDPSAAWLGRRNEACSMNIEFQNAMAALPLVAILRGITPDEIEAVGHQLVESGFRLVEVPLTSPDPFRSIGLLVRLLGPDVIVGAGTVRRNDQLDELVAVGGRMMVTPHADTALIRAASDRGLSTLPGVATPTEAFAALDAGADGLKLFPSDMIPPSAVRAFRTVVGPQIHLCPTGGVTPADLNRYKQAGATGFGLGGALYRPGDTASEVRSKADAFVTSWQTVSAHG